MRSLLMIGVFAGVCMGFNHTVVANYFFPGKVIIGGGGGGGKGGTTNAMAIGPCHLQQPVQCECYPDLPLFEACVKSGADLQCLSPEDKYLAVQQSEPVLAETGDPILADLVCTGKSDSTAFVLLPTPDGEPPP